MNNNLQVILNAETCNSIPFLDYIGLNPRNWHIIKILINLRTTHLGSIDRALGRVHRRTSTGPSVIYWDSQANLEVVWWWGVTMISLLEECWRGREALFLSPYFLFSLHRDGAGEREMFFRGIKDASLKGNKFLTNYAIILLSSLNEKNIHTTQSLKKKAVVWTYQFNKSSPSHNYFPDSF